MRLILLMAIVTTLAAQPTAAFGEGTLIPHRNGQARYELGQGFDSATRTFRGRCLDAQAFQYAGAQTATLNLDRALSAEDAATQSQVAVSAGFDAGIFGGSASVRVNSHVQSTDTSETVIYSVTNTGKDVVITQAALNQTGHAATTDREFAKHACGDEYVERIKLGGQLFFKVHYEFANRDVKNEIIKTVKIRALGFSKTVTSTDHMTDLTEHASVTVEAVQYGGRPERLQAAVTGMDRKACKLSALDRCAAMVDRLLRYVNEPGGFSEQMQDLRYEAGAPENNAAVLAYVTKRYHAGGFLTLYPESAPAVQAEQVAAITRLSTDLEQLDLDRQGGERLLQRYRLREPHKSELRQVLVGPLRRNRDAALAAITTCFRTPLRCLSREEAYWTGRESYDQRLLSKRVSFFDYCMEEGAAPARQLTIQKLLALAGTSDCGLAEAKLELMVELNLPGQSISDLAPLRGLFSLAVIDLRRNDVESVSALAGLPGLRRVLLGHNRIGSVAALANLPELEEVDLGYNRIAQGSSLDGAPRLRRLRLHGNPLLDSGSFSLTKYAQLFLTNSDYCSYERAELVKAGRIRSVDEQAFAELDMGPVYARAADRGSELSWLACEFAASTYP